jgi:hypothetical protein
MVRSGGERKGAAVPQRWITEGATMTRVTMIFFVALLLIMPAQRQRLCAEWELLYTEE